MAGAIAVHRLYDLPWSAGAEQERRFRRLLTGTLATVAVLSLLLSWLPVPESDPAAVDEIPARLARLIVEQEAPPPPPVVREEPEPEPVSEPEPAQPEPAPEPVVEQAPAEPAPEPEPAPVVDQTQQARERARSAGLMPFAEELAALRDNENTRQLGNAEALETTASSGTAPATERSLVTSRVGTASGGIDTAQLSRDTGGAGLEGRSTTQVASPVEAAAAAGAPAVRSGASDRPSRSREEIERVFDRNKGAIYALYNRALRSNPALQGKLVLRLTIAPDGAVTACEVVSSELGDADLEQKLVQRVMLFRFEQKDVEAVTTTKPIDFFPA